MGLTEILTILSILVSLGGPIAAFFWKLYGERVKDKRLHDAIEAAILRAEEYGAKQDWKSGQKHDYVVGVIQKAFPKLSKEVIDFLIDAALPALGIGAAAKKSAEKDGSTITGSGRHLGLATAEALSKIGL